MVWRGLAGQGVVPQVAILVVIADQAVSEEALAVECIVRVQAKDL